MNYKMLFNKEDGIKKAPKKKESKLKKKNIKKKSHKSMIYKCNYVRQSNNFNQFKKKLKLMNEI